MVRIKLLNPVGETKSRNQALLYPPRLDTLKGKRLGFLSNQWRSYIVIMERLKSLMSAEAGVIDTCKLIVPLARPALKEDLDKIAEKCDVAVVGFAN